MMPATASCPHCGRPVRRPRTSPVSAEASASIDLSQLSDGEVYRQFKRTAPVEDLRFFLRHARLSPDLRASGDALLAVGCRETGGALPRAEWYRRLTALHSAWRRQTAYDAVPAAGKEVA